MSAFACLALTLAVSSTAPPADAPEGLWDATLRYRDVEVPFRIEFSGRGDRFVGTLLDGDLKVSSTRGHLAEDGTFEVSYDHFLSRLEGRLEGGHIEGELHGRFSAEGQEGHGFRAARAGRPRPPAGPVPAIGGDWEIANVTAKGEKAWRLIVRQDGAEVAATILRVDGDTGTLSGSYEGDRFVLGHFAGSVPLRVELIPAADGGLTVVQQGAFTPRRSLAAHRPDVARAKGLPEPADPDEHTTLKDPDRPFTFQFPDVNQELVSSADERFRGKPLLVVVTGTWCPNCHDEARFLVELDRRYRDRGLRIVALDFEDPEQQEELTRVRAFVERYEVEYPYLIAGAPADLWSKLPEATNLNSWPTTFFVGRNGRVRSIHAGFAGPASGPYHEQVKRKFTETVERLLAEEPADVR